MKTYTQKEIEDLINLYNNADKKIIQENTRIILSHCGYKYTEIAKQIGIEVQTLYNYNKTCVKVHPNFFTALKLANFLNIDITEFIY